MRLLISCIFPMIMSLFENPVGLISDDVIVCSKMQMQRSAEANDANDEDHEAKRH